MGGLCRGVMKQIIDDIPPHTSVVFTNSTICGKHNIK